MLHCKLKLVTSFYNEIPRPCSSRSIPRVLTLLCFIVLTVFWREGFFDQWGGTLTIVDSTSSAAWIAVSGYDSVQ
jgi:hypothetical protein